MCNSGAEIKLGRLTSNECGYSVDNSNNIFNNHIIIIIIIIIVNLANYILKIKRTGIQAFSITIRH